jgi:O-antigen/teichoic acid export membrane protein
MSLKKNVLANYLSQGWTSLMGLAFVPVYIKYLGIEAYGLMGIFALVQTLFALLDLGLSPALSREMARLRPDGESGQSIRDLLRSVEFIFLGTASVMALSIWSGSNWLASDWLKPEKLPQQAVAEAFSIMGFVIALRFFEGLYRGSIVGLQKQVLLATVTAVIATLRGIGAVGVLALISPTTTAFFVWQAIISVLSAVVLIAILYRSLPAGKAGRFSLTALQGIWRFAGGMLSISILSLVLTQLDKILLSKLLSLQQYGHYMLAATAANVLYTIATPISQAFYPRYSRIIVSDDRVKLIDEYHKAAQLVTVIAGATAFMLIAFGQIALSIWTHNSQLAETAGPLLAVLALGTLLNCLLWIPHQTQLAHGIVGLAIKTNLVAIAVVIPALLWAIPLYGPIGAAWVWVALNVGYLIFNANFMYRRILSSERWNWYVKDISIPLLTIVMTGLLCRWAMPSIANRWGQFCLLSISLAILLFSGSVSASHVRQALCRLILLRLRALSSKAIGQSRLNP